MKPVGYGVHIEDTVNNMPYEAAIQTQDVALRLAEDFALPYARAKSITNVKLKRMADKGEIKRLRKGVYCQVKQTVFGKATASSEQIMRQIVTRQNGKRIGYESGLFLMNKLGLSSLIPRDMEVTTNAYSTKLPEDCHVTLKKPVTTITDDNWRYLQFIDLLVELPSASIDAENPELLLTRFAKQQKLDRLTLAFTARKHYPAKVLGSLIDLLMEMGLEMENETSSG